MKDVKEVYALGKALVSSCGSGTSPRKKAELSPLRFDKRDANVCCRSKRGAHAHATHRTSARHAGFADPANSCTRTAAWLGHFRAHPADFERRIARAAGLAVPGAASAGAARLDQGALGNVGK